MQQRRNPRTATCRMMSAGFGKQSGDSAASGKISAKKVKGKVR